MGFHVSYRVRDTKHWQRFNWIVMWTLNTGFPAKLLPTVGKRYTAPFNMHMWRRRRLFFKLPSLHDGLHVLLFCFPSYCQRGRSEEVVNESCVLESIKKLPSLYYPSNDLSHTFSRNYIQSLSEVRDKSGHPGARPALVSWFFIVWRTDKLIFKSWYPSVSLQLLPWPTQTADY